MYLKSIEVQGFKSFANKLKFEFKEGITGIVGPNGSGKSNVADAVRWVLGEQSAKQLRSGSMQDVIFAGTETRKAQSFASVAITFDNSDHRLDVDYEEVTVTRRLYRSGESEYLINNTGVRLRDIQEIFYDTGIGQEGYSIIGQGQIDRILSVRSEERRELFDEAVGIVKFKKRKKAALKKLEDEHANLLRVTDVLNELSSQLGPLKRQYETAKVYLEKKEILKKLDINLFQLEEERVDGQIEEASGKIAIAENDSRIAKEQYEHTKVEYEEIERQLEELQNHLSALSEEIAKNAVIRQQLAGQVDLLNEQIHTIETSDRQKAARKEQITYEISSRETEQDKLTSEMNEASEKEREIEQKEAEEKQKLDEIDRMITETVSAIDKAKNDVIGMLQSRASVKGKIQRYDTMLEQLEIRRSEISGRLLRLREAVLNTTKEAAEVKSSLEDVKTKLSAVKAKQDDTENQIQVKQNELKDLNDRLDETAAGYHRDSSKLDSLKAMAERYDGYGAAIKRIMDQRGRNPGIKGVVADLLEVPEQYETAIETALGGSIRNIVTDNEATAKYQIEYLKSNKLGRATFLPLTSIKARSLSDRSVLSEPGVIGTASSLVSTDDEYAVLAEHLLGRIIVIDHIDSAIRIGRKYKHSVYMVTLQGESFAPGGSITGGTFKSSDNLLGRKREIDELTESTKRLKKENEELRKKIENTRHDRNELRERLNRESDEEQKLKITLNTLQMSGRQAEEQLRVDSINCAAMEKENAEIERQMAEVREMNSGIAKKLKDSEASELEVNREAADLRERETKYRAIRQQQTTILENIRVQSAAYSEQRRFREETMERLHRECETLAAEAQSIEDSMSGSSHEIIEKQRQIDEVKKTISAAEAEAEEKNRQKEICSEDKIKLAEKNKDFFDKYEALSSQISALERELIRLTNQKERLEEAREERTNYMWEEYNLTPSEVRAQKTDDRRDDLNGIKKDISNIKSQIKQLGPVNVNAIEDYKATAERHSFLSAQHEDLIKSEETLTGIITSLDEGMRRQFNEKFAIIKTEFDAAFKELFGGGTGTIEIEPDADVLEAGIQIIAHPPGKKLQNMMQLSGGEKALTAIALLFAIQNMKPSPFCLLDEIEAALDESNVIRFAEYLHKLTKNTQFIVITHRRGTMTTADRLYGITMQEKGVSALVSVNLIDDKLTG